MKLIMVMLFMLSIDHSGNPLAQFQWKNRIVLVFSGDQTEGALQIEALKEFEDECLDRDLLLLGVGDDVVSPSYNEKLDAQILRSRFDIKDGEFHLLLIGKDGGVKLKQTSFTEPKVIFSLIDSMPMRQWEMRKKG